MTAVSGKQKTRGTEFLKMWLKTRHFAELLGSDRREHYAPGQNGVFIMLLIGTSLWWTRAPATLLPISQVNQRGMWHPLVVWLLWRLLQCEGTLKKGLHWHCTARGCLGLHWHWIKPFTAEFTTCTAHLTAEQYMWQSWKSWYVATFLPSPGTVQLWHCGFLKKKFPAEQAPYLGPASLLLVLSHPSISSDALRNLMVEFHHGPSKMCTCDLRESAVRMGCNQHKHQWLFGIVHSYTQLSSTWE